MVIKKLKYCTGKKILQVMITQKYLLFISRVLKFKLLTLTVSSTNPYNVVIPNKLIEFYINGLQCARFNI